MSDAISLLEHLACMPYATDDDVAGLTEALDPAARAAITDGDPRSLVAAVGGRAVMACMVFSPDREEPGRDDAPLEDQPEPTDSPGESDA